MCKPDLANLVYHLSHTSWHGNETSPVLALHAVNSFDCVLAMVIMSACTLMTKLDESMPSDVVRSSVFERMHQVIEATLMHAILAFIPRPNGKCLHTLNPYTAHHSPFLPCLRNTLRNYIYVRNINICNACYGTELMGCV